jgi:hypothetical protein
MQFIVIIENYSTKWWNKFSKVSKNRVKLKYFKIKESTLLIDPDNE